MYFPVCGTSAAGQEVNRGFVSTTNQPLSLNTPGTMLPSILNSCYFVTLSLCSAFLIHKIAQMFSVKAFNEKKHLNYIIGGGITILTWTVPAFL